ncbi:MAG: hypothetical protein J7M38_04505 [Armatimonadetes bacterium]|nr:hypothetical protein [Armatimonadota bacterium]
MSNEDDLMEEETSDESPDEVADVEGDDTFDGEVEIPQGRGCSAGTWIIILLIIAALIYVGVWQFKKQAAEQAARDAAARQQVREAQLSDIGADLATVESRLQSGDVAGALQMLQQMDQKLEIMQTAANTSGDADAALALNSMRSVVQKAVKDIGDQYEQLKQAADTSVGAVRKALGAHAPPPAATEEAVETPAAGAEATEGGEQPAEVESTAPPAEEATQPPADEPAAGAEAAPPVEAEPAPPVESEPVPPEEPAAAPPA